ncbi:hypothetical protein ACQKNT_25135 [Bacillus cereus]|uniref:hypothetical protein n=1 Tax=Bacillus cereus group TaxID=86661 RepID=UPI0037F69A28
MQNLIEWSKKNWLLRDMLDSDRDIYFAPKKFTINIRSGVPAHKIIDEAKKIAVFVKPSIKTSPYKMLNTVMFKALQNFEDNTEPKPNDTRYLQQFSCFLYFVTVTKKINKNNVQVIKKFKGNIKEEALNIQNHPKNKNFSLIEKIVYVGHSADLIRRYTNGHSVTQKLNDPKWNSNLHEKKIYIATVEVNTDILKEEVDLPLEILKPYRLVNSILRFLESFFINYFGVPEYNTQGKTPKIDFPSWPRIPMVKEIILPKYPNSILFDKNIEFNQKQIIEILGPAIEKKIKKIKKNSSSLV